MTTLSNDENEINVSYGKAEEMGIYGPYAKLPYWNLGGNDLPRME